MYFYLLKLAPFAQLLLLPTLLTSTHTGPYGFKNFVQNNVFAFLQYITTGIFTIERDIKKAFKTFFFDLVQEYSPAQGKPPFS